ncbi:Mdm33 family-domain-containing protein [Gongronella butleri]|nr:Mdm33 family-domain-containing protein [Gongronella butleri]
MAALRPRLGLAVRLLRPPRLSSPCIRVSACSCPYSTQNTPGPHQQAPGNDDKDTQQHQDDKKPLPKPLQLDSLASLQSLSRTQLQRLQVELEPLVARARQAQLKLKHLTSNVSDSQEAVRRMSIALNEITGYKHIETVKQKVQDQAQAFELTREQVQVAKARYELAIATRSNTQRGINELLQRKHLWTGDDVNQFTELYRLEHEHAKEEELAKEQYQRSEKQMDREYMDLARCIMERYHDEQLWSDKIRSVSTYGTWALMALNIMLFIAVQTVFEPRKRKRLTDQFETLLVEKVQEEEDKFNKVSEAIAETDRVLLEQQQTLVDLMSQLALAPTPEPALVPEDTLKITPEPDLHELDAPSLPSSPQAAHISNESLVLYTVESAIAGSLVTALAFMLWK